MLKIVKLCFLANLFWETFCRWGTTCLFFKKYNFFCSDVCSWTFAAGFRSRPVLRRLRLRNPDLQDLCLRFLFCINLPHVLVTIRKSSFHRRRIYTEEKTKVVIACRTKDLVLAPGWFEEMDEWKNGHLAEWMLRKNP